MRRRIKPCPTFPSTISATLSTPPSAHALLRRSETDLSGFIEKVEPIIEAVRTEGDKALVRFAREFDKADLEPARISRSPKPSSTPPSSWSTPSVIEAIRFGIDNIRRFHEEQKPEPMWLKEMRPGAFAGDRFTPIRSVALYVPRGKGAFPSVTMMTSVPAVVAGVPETRHRHAAGAGRLGRRRDARRRAPRRRRDRLQGAAARRRSRPSPMAPKRSSRR